MVDDDLIPSEILHGKPGQEVFWLVEELISCRRLVNFLELVQNGQEIMWRNDDIFPFIMFSKESLVFVGSIELPYIPRQRHHSYIILRELETSGKVLFHPKSFCDS